MFSYHPILVLAILAVVLVGFNSLSASWTPPTAPPPDDNVPAPINIGTTYQVKAGAIGAISMRAGVYCSVTGSHCLDLENFYCGPNQAIAGITPSGSLICVNVVSSVPPPTNSYSWYLGPQDQFSGSCGSPRDCGSYCTATGVVQCRNSEGAVVSDSNCTEPKPTNSRITNFGSICSSGR